MSATQRRSLGRLGCVLSLACLAAPVSTQPVVDVPLAPYISQNHPGGFALGWALGLSFGDYDADGWVDLYDNLTGQLWRNAEGRDWTTAANLQPVLVPRYGGSFCDYNRDGLPDLATEPRPGACFNLFRNDGNGAFTDVAALPAVFAVRPCQDASETVCWGDVDFDGWPDLFLPTYPPPVGSTGRQDNYFWRNSDPLQAGGERTFVEISRAAGLAIPAGRNRPEGAQLCDYDADGDLDLYCNGGIYRNESLPGQPRFTALSEAASGIGLSSALDEGAAFFDYDLDGDFDAMSCLVNVGVTLWENRGDGTFFAAETSIIELPAAGRDFGLSIADWDNDGDLDCTTRFVFRRNQLIETGQRSFTVATNNVNPAHIVQPTIAWADSDRDGDLDAAIGNYWVAGHGTGHFYENTTYGGATPAVARRYLRVVPWRDEAQAAGTETEFGAIAELRLAGDPWRRRQFTASGHGYLNQNEYALHFGLPPQGRVFADIAVDFPSDPAQGVWRVDGGVNPVLRGVDLNGLGNPEIHVFRGGRVRLGGCDVQPVPQESPSLQTTAGGLSLPPATASLPPPLPASTQDTFAGIEVRTHGAPVRVIEIVVDGQLGASGPFQIAVWDVSGPGPAQLVRTAVAATSARNDRTALAVDDLLLRSDRRYRVVANLASLRVTPINGPVAQTALTTTGGLLYADPQASSGNAVAEAVVDPTAVYLALRYRPALLGTGIDLGNGLATIAGALAVLSTPQPFQAGRVAELRIDGLPPSASVMLAAGLGVRSATVEGRSFLIPGGFPVLLPGNWVADQQGVLRVPLPWPNGLPLGLGICFQGWYGDPVNPALPASTNAVLVASP